VACGFFDVAKFFTDVISQDAVPILKMNTKRAMPAPTAKVRQS
jgi:hypothetical protein